ncbi:MAG: NADH-quinone oxidoreductase subunit J [Chloroflexota bacterium]
MAAQDVYVAIAFYVIAALTIFGAVGMIVAQNLVRSAVLLIVTLGGAAAIYVLLGADFLGMVQLLVYVGAIMILMLFAIMLTPRQVDLPSTTPGTQKIAAAITALVIGGISLATLLSHPWNVLPQPASAPTSEPIGTLILSTYVLPFEIASVLLTVGMIGAIVIARED